MYKNLHGLRPLDPRILTKMLRLGTILETQKLAHKLCPPPPQGWAINIIRCIVCPMFCVLKNIIENINVKGF